MVRMIDLEAGSIVTLSAGVAALHALATRARRPLRTLLIATFSLLALTAVDAVLFPMALDGQALPWRYRTNLVPGRGILDLLSGPVVTRNAVVNIVGNLLVLAPLGLLAPMLWPRLGRPAALLAAAFAVSAGFELVQLFAGRSVDVDDVLLNTAGAGLGLAALRLGRRVWPRRHGAAGGGLRRPRAPAPPG